MGSGLGDSAVFVKEMFFKSLTVERKIWGQTRMIVWAMVERDRDS